MQYIDSGWNFEMVRLGVNRFDGTHKADDIEAWFIHNLKQFIPDKIIQNYLSACAIDEAGNGINAMKKLGFDAQRCVGHRMNTAVRWATGISGAESKNPDIRNLLAKVAKIVTHFSHSSIAKHSLCENQEYEVLEHELLRPS